ncbi:signal peptidase I [Streptomyces kaniharaensis]|uniref:Signal peptidase I n=1 Tax=Streptomyces kaniharaensis TaxID=212423 RepID=A0A6N7KPV7_9ACTN|nr:signal peptidase I [Streptomyces kaniharaensis]MQS12367.1 signal peptidase I [Streptomyces kaniharaensis]
MAVNLPETPSEAGAGPAPAPGGRAEARRRARGGRGRGVRRTGHRSRPWWIEVPAMLAVGLGVALLIKTSLFQVFTIPSGSMENTLRVGDRVGVNKLAPLTGWKPEPGQPVVFKDPGDWLPPQPIDGNPVTHAMTSALSFVGLVPPKDNYLVKRVIATGGQTVQCTGTTLTVDGRKVDEPYLHAGDDSCAHLNFGPVTVPAGHIWVEGDHRSDSADSRYHRSGPGGGAVPVDDVVGPVSAVVWPLNHLDWFGWVGR